MNNLEKWKTPIAVTDVQIAFGECSGLIPDYDDIPEEYKSDKHPMNRVVSNLFFNGSNGITIDRIDDVADFDDSLVFRQIKAVLASYAIKHEHKIAGVAFILSQFYKEVVLIPFETTEK